jgi:site-specific DNA-methyltransferase (adenine-specific)
MLNQIIHGDSSEVLKGFPDDYFDALISDPPSSISFMNKKWDDNKGGMLNWINWLSEIMAECLRVMKPGACGLIWSLPRTSHWTGMALELAGFRIIDIVHHANGEGFPKGQDIGRLLDNLAGEEREVIGLKIRPDGTQRPNYKNWGENDYLKGLARNEYETAPASPEAKQWDGWKTPALKPAIEDWWLVQKPISESSIARNILKHGVGGLNIEAARITVKESDPNHRVNPTKSGELKSIFGIGDVTYGRGCKEVGRYPSNLILSCGANCKGENHSPDCPVSVIGGQTGESISRQNQVSDNRRYAKNVIYGSGLPGERHRLNSHSDSGTAARYFKQLPFDPETIPSVYYQAKASPNDRSNSGEIANTHPTVKSRHLMKYLITLITPDNGTVLDPFCGSGTTAVACKELGRNYICIEKEKEYFDIACDRISQPREYSETELEIMELKQPEFKQLSLFDVA